MTGSVRTILRALVAVALSTLALFGLAGQAVAHPVVTGVPCDSLSNATIACSVFYTGAHEPVDIRWYFNGVHDPAFDDDRNILRRCELGKKVNVKVVVTDIHGSGTGFNSVPCGTPQ